MSQIVQVWAVQCERCEDYEGHYEWRSDAEDAAEEMVREDGRVLCNFCANPLYQQRLA